MTVKNKTNETGRSMVEMLGVLAIVGVLSVGGVYGYGVAMKKHKANEALHKASMLATTVSAYAMSNDGNLPSTITDFANFGYNTSVTDDGTKFKLTISGLDDGVCEQLQNLQGGMMREAICTGTTATLSYYKNLATNDEEGKNSPTGGSGDGSGGETEPSCTLTETDCPVGVDTENCVCESSEGQTCTSHTENQCGLGYYCQFSPSNCSASGDGVCTKITGGDDSSGHWVGPTLDWWSANSWCIGKGRSGSITYSTLQSAYGCDKSTHSCDWSALKADGLEDYYWVGEIKEGGDALYVFVYTSYFGYHGRYEGKYALCE